MEKIILFGASRGGMNFIINNHKNYEFLAVADNDNTKIGQMVEGIIIINPSDILTYSFDKVIIASMFFKSISKQLLDLGVPNKKIEYASKNSMKVIQYPFSNSEILSKAEKLIALISNVLKDEQYYFTFGTCLAIVRDGELIPWDDDIDIAIYNNNAEKILDIIQENVLSFDEIIENKIYLRRYSDNRLTSISIDCLKGGEVLFNINLDCIHIEDIYGKTEIDRIPLEFYQEPSVYKFKDSTIKLPTNYLDYLTYVYKDWKVVRKHTSFFNNTTTYVEPTLKVISELVHESKKL